MEYNMVSKHCYTRPHTLDRSLLARHLAPRDTALGRSDSYSSSCEYICFYYSWLAKALVL